MQHAFSDREKALLANGSGRIAIKATFQVVQIARLESSPWSLLLHGETLNMD
jgi:hypothetical protein